MPKTPEQKKGEETPLFAARKDIFPAKIKGKFRTTKWVVMVFLLGIYYLAPFLRYYRGVGAPDQAILIDIPGRKFYFFFIEVWPQEVYYFTGLLLLGALSLFFATTLFGRVWCGYACPQTVWTDLFINVERWIEGDRHRQIRLKQAPWTFNKIAKKITKHFLWIAIAFATGGALILYFNDAPTLAHQFLTGTVSLTALFWMCFMAGFTYLMAGFAREQACTYMCPYARFQGSMLDEYSLVVAYDEKRGEPRGKTPTGGDCIDCNKCVHVCPMGIDIRNGQQYQCINCALCIDACNSVMAKINKPLGLIRYNNLNSTIPTGTPISKIWKVGKFIRIRTIYYAVIMAVVATVTLYALINRPLMDLNVIRDRNPLYVIMTNGKVRNSYTVRLVNKTWATQTYTLTTTLPNAIIYTNGQKQDSKQALHLQVAPGKVGTYKLFIETPINPDMPEHAKFTINAKAQNTKGAIQDSYRAKFVSPKV